MDVELNVAENVAEIIYPASRELARLASEKLYLTGKACPQGHFAPRYESNGACSECLHVYTAKGIRGELPPKTCRRCGTQFTKRPCPECARVLRNKWAANHREYLARLQRDRINRCRLYVRTLKEATPCKDCNKQYPWYVIEFDHVNGRNNRGETVADRVRQGHLQRLKDEIAKCDLVCANCHKRRTYSRAIAAGTWKEL